MKIQKPKLLFFSILISQLAGIIGSFATAPAIPTWYADLTKPAFNPPNWLFGPAWITLYTLMGISFYLILIKESENKKKKIAIKFFLIHLFVNSLWSIIFFGYKNLSIAFFVIIILWLMIASMIKLFWHIDKKASYLLLPYILWVSFATLLNFSIWQLN